MEGAPINGVEIYDPARQSFRLADAPPAQEEGLLRVEAFLPECIDRRHGGQVFGHIVNTY